MWARCLRAFSWICFVSSMPLTMVRQVCSSVSILMELPEQYHRMAIPELVKNNQKEDTQLWEALDYVRERANEVS